MSGDGSTGKKREAAAPPTKTWSIAARVAVSAVLVWHLTAVLVGPFSLPPNELCLAVLPAYRPYTGPLYLHNSYKFFAPNPGPSHLVRYELEFADGSHRAGIFPSLKDEWPRLLYHRHFMLSEFANNQIAPPTPPGPGAPAAPPSDWAHLPTSPGEKACVQSYADHLLHKNHAVSAKLWLVEHGIPDPEQVVNGMKLDDHTLYSERYLGSFAANP